MTTDDVKTTVGRAVSITTPVSAADVLEVTLPFTCFTVTE